jgi:hypothetical protein
MRALTVQQPHAHAIMHLGKNVENRSCRTRYRGALAIHAGLAVDQYAGGVVYEWRRALEGPDEDLPRGVVLGVVQLVDTHHADECRTQCSPWGRPSAWHWVLEEPRPIGALFPARGNLGLWLLPADVARMVTP